MCFTGAPVVAWAICPSLKWSVAITAAQRVWLAISSQKVLPSVLVFPGGSPTSPDNHLPATTTLFFFYKTLLQWSVSWQTQVGDSLAGIGKRWHSWLLAVGVFLWESEIGCLQPFLLDPDCDCSLQSGTVRSVSWQCCLFPSHPQVLGPCNRCQMICIDQQTGQRNQDVFQKLSERRERKVSMIAKYDTPS